MAKSRAGDCRDAPQPGGVSGAPLPFGSATGMSPRPAIRPLWMAPALQEKSCRYGDLVGCSLLSGLLMQPRETAGPDGVGEQGPNLLIRL